jgi:hypothetical protein
MRLGLTKKIYTAQELLSFSLDKVRIDEVYRKQDSYRINNSIYRF